MRFYTAEIDGAKEILVGFRQSETVYRLNKLAKLTSSFAYSDMNDLICRMDEAAKAKLQALAKNTDVLAGAEVKLSEVKLCAPVVYPRQDIICLGINYVEHAQEVGKYSEEAFGGERPYTIYFSKRVNKATATGEKIPSYAGLVDSLDYEVELGVIIGRDAKDVSKADALNYVFGYTVINDVSARNLQTRHKQWYRGKSLDGFTPMGPCIVTADEFDDIQNLNIKCYVNGELRQNSNTSLMIQDVAGAVAELSEGMTLKAGTIIATGTPGGVGMGMLPPKFLQKGDVVVCEIEKIGRIENIVD